jgi:dephospho-CoA kinase
MKNPVVGITGIMASGKSSLCKALGDLGFRVISADDLVQALYQKGSKGLQAIAKLNINDIINKDGSVNKPKLRDLMFSDQNLRKKIEKAVHPIVIAEIKELIAKDDKKPVAVEIPLLFEANLEDLCSYTVTVFRKRGHSLTAIKEKYKIALAEAENMLNAQLDMAEKMIRADFTVFNDGSLADLKKKAEILKRSVMTLWGK